MFFKKLTAVGMTALAMSAAFIFTGVFAGDKVRAADEDLELVAGQTLALDMKNNRKCFLHFTAASSGLYEISSTGSNNVDCEMMDEHKMVYNPAICDQNSGNNGNFDLLVNLTGGKEYYFQVKYPGSSYPCNANDTKVTISKYEDNTAKVCDITTANFPDILFKVYVGDNFDLNGDGYLSQKEVGKIKVLSFMHDYEDNDFSSFKGIEYFTSLTSLSIQYYSNLKSLDLSKNTALKTLYVDGTQITSLDLKNNTRLTSVQICSTPITSLDLSRNRLLQKLLLFRVDFKKLDLANQTALSELEVNQVEGFQLVNLKNCSNLRVLKLLYCDITSLDLTGLTELENLQVYGNKLASLDLSPCKNIDHLSCSTNELTSLDLKGLTKLRDLRCDENKLTGIDLSKNTKLRVLNVSDNPLTKLDLSNNAALIELLCHDTDITALDITKCPGLLKAYNHSTSVETKETYIEYVCNVWFTDSGYVPFTLYVPKNAAVTATEGQASGISLDKDHFPDPVLLDKVKTYDYNSDGILSAEENEQLTYINMDYSDLADLTGIEYLTNMICLSCCNCKLTSIDVSKNPILTQLFVSHNQLTKIDISKHTGLLYLSCQCNNLESLDISNNRKLKNLNCYGNKIKTLDISNNPALINIYKDGDIVDSGIIYGHRSGDYDLTYDRDVKIIAAKPTATPTATPTSKPEIKLTLNKKTASVVCGLNIDLKATLTGSSETITWKSSNKKIASVDSKGKVKCKMAGEVTITASAAGKTAECVVTVLYKDVTNSDDFWFVPTNCLTAKSVVKGYAKQTEFRPTNKCTRAQMVTFIWRLMGEPEPKTKKCKFKDVKSSDYFYKACIWGNEKHIVEGYKNGKFGPKIVCARRHAVTFLWRLAGKPDPKTTKSKFSDVKKTDYFYQASLWAAEKKILVGYDDGSFRPNGACLRRQMVTLLYKYDQYVNKKN